MLVLEEVCRLKGKRSLSLLLAAVLLVLLVCCSVLGLCVSTDVLILYPMAPMMCCVSDDALLTSRKGSERCQPADAGRLVCSPQAETGSHPVWDRASAWLNVHI